MALTRAFHFGVIGSPGLAYRVSGFML